MVTNLDVGVRRSLCAYLAADGETEERASARADGILGEAVSFVRAAFESRKDGGHKKMPDSRHWAFAFNDLKGWAIERVAADRAEEARIETERVQAERVAEEAARVAETERLLAEAEAVRAAAEAERIEAEQIEVVRALDAARAEAERAEATPERAETQEMEIEHLAELVAESSEPKDLPALKIEELFPTEPQPIEPTKKKSKKKK